MDCSSNWSSLFYQWLSVQPIFQLPLCLVSVRTGALLKVLFLLDPFASSFSFLVIDSFMCSMGGFYPITAQAPWLRCLLARPQLGQGVTETEQLGSTFSPGRNNDGFAAVRCVHCKASVRPVLLLHLAPRRLTSALLNREHTHWHFCPWLTLDLSPIFPHHHHAHRHHHHHHHHAHNHHNHQNHQIEQCLFISKTPSWSHPNPAATGFADINFLKSSNCIQWLSCSSNSSWHGCF